MQRIGQTTRATFPRRAGRTGAGLGLVLGRAAGLAASLLAAQAGEPEWSPVVARPLTVPASARVGFTLMDPARTGLTFTNVLSDARAAENQIRLNGAGMAAGDVDGDGLADLYFCGLENANVLYRNLGNWRFEDVTVRAGVACADQYSTGAVFADVDGDNDLDLLVGSLGGGVRLFRNDGAGRFSEDPKAGLARRYCVTTLALADVDGDGDLDLYVCHYRTTTVRSTGLELLRVGGRRMLRPEDRDDYELLPNGRLLEHGEPDQLYLNNGRGRFTPVDWTGGAFRLTDGTPLTRPPRDWSLTAMFRDLDRDGAPDLYVCGDFHSPDRLWWNDGGGRFHEAAPLTLRHTSTFSMAVDFADVDRDGRDDFFVADMLGTEHARRLMQRAGSDPNLVVIGRFDDRPQYDRSVLQWNRGDGTFAEIAAFAGVEANDWAWSVVFLDVDLDGYEDLLCNTGHAFDTQDVDADLRIAALGPMPRAKVPGKLLLYPRLPMARLAFRNRGNLTFEDASAAWGFNARGVSHGLTLADLDGDGDLDVIANNLNAPAAVYRLDTAAPRLTVRLRGRPPNTQGIGARLTLRGPGPEQSQEVIAGGRYLSGADPLRVFAAPGPGPWELEVRWRSGRWTRLTNLAANHLYEVAEPAAPPLPASPAPAPPAPWFEDLTERLGHQHPEPPFDDFAVQPLLPVRLSQGGPGVAWGDLDGDGWEDLVIGSGKGGPLAVFLNDGQGGFTVRPRGPGWAAAGDYTGLLIRQGADGPAQILAGVASLEGPVPAAVVAGRWAEPAVTALVPRGPASPGPLALADYDGDGELDLLVGGRTVPGRYPEPADSALLRGVGGRWEPDAANAGVLQGVGLVNGAVFSDVNSDGWPDLVLACEWGPVRLFLNRRGRFEDATAAWGLDRWTGRWTGVNTGDFDGDGRQDLVVGNWGWNDPARATPERPLRLYYGDFDDSGTWDILAAYHDPRTGREVPWQDLGTLSAALPFLRGRFPTYGAFGRATVSEVLGNAMRGARRVEAGYLASTLFLNRGDHFEARPLPAEAQWAPAFGIAVADFDGDGAEDVFLSQNFFAVAPDYTRYDAGRGLLLRGDGRGGLAPVPGQISGLKIYGEQRGCAVADFDHDGRPDLVVTQNGAATRLYRNRQARPGVRLRLVGPPGNPAGWGAVVRLGDGQRWGPARELHGGAGYWSQDGAVVIPAYAGAATQVQVRWPGRAEPVSLRLPADARAVEVRMDGSVVAR